MTQQPREMSALVEALRAVLAEHSLSLQPGHLRLQVEAALGADQAQQLRREIHQVVAAAEDHLPTRLTRITPLTTVALARLSQELATSRGWAAGTAERATRAWAGALGFDELAEVEWPTDAGTP